MPLHYHRIQHDDDPALALIRDLYESAFPEHERRDWASFLTLINDPRMHVDVILDAEQALGFLIWWKLNDYCFIEHFAISERVRGAGYGSEVIKHFLKESKGKVLLEVEPPGTPDADRRITFYERLGFVIVNIDYRQPSYVEKGLSYPMYLLQSGAESETEIAKLIPVIHSAVYFI
ncbi:GNAT family N-acetyltransferase [Pedobacter sp.]|uniref:GNAT family N-acetyltransferase n=1 Tax=Pedobacter sp. TaxID=1411316 RepID=UPI003D7F8D5F